MLHGFSRIFIHIFQDGSEEKSDEFIKLRDSMAAVAVMVTSVIVLIFLISLYFSIIYPDQENKLTGPFGDLFNGILAPVLSFLTFCGLLVTIFIQQHQLKLTLREFELNRQENAKSTEALEGQLKNSYAQKFDGNFYSLLQKQEKITSDFLADSQHSVFSETLRLMREGQEYEEVWLIEKDRYLKFFLINYQILDYISFSLADEIIDFEAARRYKNIVRAVTPNEFLELLLINCQSDKYKKYKTYLVEAKFFEHFSFGERKAPFFAKLFATWPLDCFGDKARIREYFKKNERKIITSHLYFLPEDIESAKKFISIENVYSRIGVNQYKEYFERISKFEQFYFDKIADLNTEDIVVDQKLFDAFVCRDIEYFLNYLNADRKNLDDLREFLSSKFLIPSRDNS